MSTPRTTGPGRPRRPYLPAWRDVARGLAGFLGLFTVLNQLGNLFAPDFDANLWWIDMRALPPLVGHLVLASGACGLLLYAGWPRYAARLRHPLALATGGLLAMTVANTITFYRLLDAGVFTTYSRFPLSLWLSLALLSVLLAQLSPGPPDARAPRWGAMLSMLLACALLFPLAQMFCFGYSDYRRQVDAIVVFGCLAYADGRCSVPLADRVDTACALYQQGLARYLIFSGGPAAGGMHETEAMRRRAMRHGVPDSAILLDRDGLDTQATVRNTRMLIAAHDLRTVIAVSHFYHLPRVKMTFQRAGCEVYTVPARESYALSAMPMYVLREIPALWMYYLRPLWGI